MLLVSQIAFANPTILLIWKIKQTNPVSLRAGIRLFFRMFIHTFYDQIIATFFLSVLW